MDPIDSARVLVIDDDVLIRAVLRRALRGDCPVIEAEDARSGMRAFEQHEPVVVVVDVGLPDGDGWELAMEMRRRRPGVRTVVISGDPLEAEREREVDWFVAKPFEPAAVRKGIGYLMTTAGQPPAPVTPPG
jgi:two-component system chemotaxis response regulator CheY